MVAERIITSINAVLYVAIIPFVGIALPKASAIVQAPWWAWIGGLLGGFYVLASIFFAKRLGATLFIGISVTAGLVTSVVLDHFGLVGFKQHTAGICRILGCLFMIDGLSLVSVF